MRIYENLTEATKEIERDLWEMGSVYQSASVQDQMVGNDPGYAMMEVTGYGYKITNFDDLDSFIEDNALNRQYIDAEFTERVLGKAYNPGAAWLFRRSIWEKFLRGGKFSYTYSERLSNMLQLERIVEELIKHPNSRQCVAMIYQPTDILRIGGIDRIPCSMFYQFTARNNFVDLHYVMRSCDFKAHFPYDLTIAIRILQWMSQRTKMSPGVFHHYITSLHAFRKDFPPGIF